MEGKGISPKDVLKEGALSVIKQKGIKLEFKNRSGSDNPKYTKRQFINIYQGYDFLENLVVVRAYIQKKYKIRFILLEILLYLAPKNVFTFSDYRYLAKDFKYNKIQNILDTGYVKIIVEGENKTKHLYGLSPKGKHLIGLFYEYLSGEKRIPEDRRQNVMAAAKAAPFDKMKMEMIRKLNQTDVKDHMKQLF